MSATTVRRILLALLAAALPTGVGAQQPAPILPEQVVAMVRAGITEARVRTNIGATCLTQPLDVTQQTALRRAQASEALIQWLDEQVCARPATLQLNPLSRELRIGESRSLSVQVLDQWRKSIAGTPIRFESDAPDVATVDPGGTVRAVGAGEARITVAAGTLSSIADVRVAAPVLGEGFGPEQFALIPAGTFSMGAKSSPYDNERPVRTVTLSRSFYMQRTEVTQGQWAAVMGSNPSYFRNCGSRCPVEQVSWEDVQVFLERLNHQGTGRYRLPTEAEWEYAARAGSLGETYGPLDAVAWYSRNAGRQTHEVAQKQANAWGLYDILGNVWELVGDWYGPYANASAYDPTGPSTGTSHVRRGGSWFNFDSFVRAAIRDSSDNSSFLNFLIGCRLVWTP